MKAFPRTPSSIDTSLATDSLVIYENNGSPFLATILAFKKNKYVVLNFREREVELPPNRLYPLLAKLPAGIVSNQQKIKYLHDVFEASTAVSERISLEEIWSAVSDTPREYSPKELCELNFGDTKLENFLAIWWLLLHDKIYFRRTKIQFEPRSKETVDQLKIAKELEERKAREQHESVEIFRQRLANSRTIHTPASLSKIRLLEDLAAEVPSNDRDKEAREFLSLCLDKLSLEINGNMPQKAFRLLLALGHFHEHQNLALIRHKPPLKFSEVSMGEAASLTIPTSLSQIQDPKDRSIRIDLTSADSFTIDDLTTKDMDDAISLEPSKRGYTLGIHISDVASLIPNRSSLDKDARARATSIYCPEKPINMLPDALAADKASLLVGVPRLTISAIFELDSELNILETRITPSMIKVSSRYNYDDVDRLLDEGHHVMTLLYRFCGKQEMRRIEKGAIKIARKDVNVIIDEDWSFKLIEIDENSPARSLIGELMILANSAFAGFAAENKIPMIFRTQDPPDAEDHQADSEGMSSRPKLKPSALGFKPGPHAALGLDVYAQVTSPIRRYSDLVNQRQILSFLKGEPLVYKIDHLKEIMTDIESALSTARQVSFESKRYWLLRYLEKVYAERRTIHGTIIRTDLKRPLVELSEIHMNTMVDLKGNRRINEDLTLKIASVSARDDFLRLEEA